MGCIEGRIKQNHVKVHGEKKRKKYTKMMHTISLLKTQLDLLLKNRCDYLSVTSTMGEQMAKEIELLECPHPS